MITEKKNKYLHIIIIFDNPIGFHDVIAILLYVAVDGPSEGPTTRHTPHVMIVIILHYNIILLYIYICDVLYSTSFHGLSARRGSHEKRSS